MNSHSIDPGPITRFIRERDFGSFVRIIDGIWSGKVESGVTAGDGLLQDLDRPKGSRGGGGGVGGHRGESVGKPTKYIVRVGQKKISFLQRLH